MYTCRFIRDDGETFAFDYDHRIIFDLDPLSELDVTISTSQGFQQVGEMVENRSVSGVYRQISGTIVGNASWQKRQMLNVFLPFSNGKLYFNDKYYCDCVVSKTPAIGAQTRDCKFSIMLYCNYPYWYNATESTPAIGVWQGAFQFPVCYDEHIYGTMDSSAFTTITNQGNADAAIDITFEAEYTVSNYGIINADTLEKLQINDTLHIGESSHVYRDGTNIYVEKTVDGVTEDIFALLDEDSDLFYLHPGQNIIRTFADDDENVICRIKYRDVWVGVYDGM